jgi:hypothetical protein
MEKGLLSDCGLPRSTMESCSLLKPESTYLGTEPALAAIGYLPPIPFHTLFTTTGMLRGETSSTQPPLQSFLYKYNDYSVTQENNKGFAFLKREAPRLKDKQ